MRGWLGAYTPEGFIATAMADVRLPCHTAVDYDADDWEELAEAAPECTGNAVIDQRCEQNSGDDRRGLAKFRRQNEREQLGFIADFSEGDDARRDEERFQWSSFGTGSAMQDGITGSRRNQGFYPARKPPAP